MNDWIKAQKKKWETLYKSSISDFNKNAFNRLISLREGIDPQSKNNHGKLSQRSLSEILDILPQNYNKIEKGKLHGGNNVTLEQAIKLSLFYGCTIDYIAYGKQAPDSMRPIDDTEKNKIVHILEESLQSEKDMNKMLRDKIKMLEEQLAKRK